MADINKASKLVDAVRFDQDYRLQIEMLEVMLETDDASVREALHTRMQDLVRQWGTVREKIAQVIAKNLTDDQVETLLALYQVPAMQAFISETVRRQLITAMPIS